MPGKEIKPQITVSQVLYCLAEMEKQGQYFYEGMLAGTQSKRVRALAEMMIRAEKRHGARFLKYAEMAETGRSDSAQNNRQSLPGQVAHLLRKQLFATPESAAGFARNASDAEVVKEAIRGEEKSALLLTELRDYVPQSQRAYLTRVINEEWHHKTLLEELLRRHFKEK